MLASLVLASAMVAQAPPKPVQAQAAAKASSARQLIAKRRAKKAAAYSRTMDMEARQAIAEAEAQAAAEKQYMRMLPYMLEHQRQQLDRMSAYERNVALNRMAGAMERSTGYATAQPQPTRVVNLPGQPLVP